MLIINKYPHQSVPERMSYTGQRAQPRASGTTSSPSSAATSSKQDYEKAFASPAAPNPLLNAPISDSNDDLLDVPQPGASRFVSSQSPRAASGKQDHEKTLASPTASNFLSDTPFLDSDDDLSDAPETPFYPTSPMWPRFPPTAPRSDSEPDLSGLPETPGFPTSPTWPRFPPTAPRSDSEPDLSGLPETPGFPTSPMSPMFPLDRPRSDSDPDLSRCPETPFYPTSPMFPNTPNNTPNNTPFSDSDGEVSEGPGSPRWPRGVGPPPARLRGIIRLASPPPYCQDPDCPVRQVLRHHYQGRYRHEDEPPREETAEFKESNPPPHVWEMVRKNKARDHSSTIEDDWKVFTFIRLHRD